MGTTYTTAQLRELHEQLKSVTVYPDALTAFHWSTLAATIEHHNFYSDRFFYWVCNTGKQMFPRYYQWLVGVPTGDLVKHLNVKNPAVRVIIQWRLRYG